MSAPAWEGRQGAEAAAKGQLTDSHAPKMPLPSCSGQAFVLLKPPTQCVHPEVPAHLLSLYSRTPWPSTRRCWTRKMLSQVADHPGPNQRPKPHVYPHVGVCAWMMAPSPRGPRVKMLHIPTLRAPPPKKKAKSVLESANPAWTRSVHLDAPGQRHGQQPVSGTAGVVKQDKSSRGSVDTTKTRSDPQRVRMCKGERPIGAAKGKRTNTSQAVSGAPPPRGGYHRQRPRAHTGRQGPMGHEQPVDRAPQARRQAHPPRLSPRHHITTLTHCAGAACTTAAAGRACGRCGRLSGLLIAFLPSQIFESPKPPALRNRVRFAAPKGLNGRGAGSA